MGCRLLPQSLSGLPLTGPSQKNIACQGRHSNRVKHSNNRRRSSSSQLQMHHRHLCSSHHLWSPPLLTCGGWSSRCMHICSMWPTSRRLIIGVRCSWMRASTSTPCISRAKIPAISRGLPPSSLGPQLHGLEMGPIFRQGQDPQGSPKMKMELRKTMTWLMWWTSSFEEAELFGRDRLKTVNLSLFCFYHFRYLFVISLW